MVFQMMDSYFLALGFSRWTALAPSASGAALWADRIRYQSAAPGPPAWLSLQVSEFIPLGSRTPKKGKKEKGTP